MELARRLTARAAAGSCEGEAACPRGYGAHWCGRGAACDVRAGAAVLACSPLCRRPTASALHTLNVAYSGMTRRAAAVLAVAVAHGLLPSLESLTLSGNDLRRAGDALRALVRHRSALASLFCNDCALSDADVTLLSLSLARPGPPLAHLSLAANEFGAKGLVVLAQALQRNDTLESLNLNKWGRDAAAGAAGAGSHVHLTPHNLYGMFLEAVRTNAGRRLRCLALPDTGTRQQELEMSALLAYADGDECYEPATSK